MRLKISKSKNITIYYVIKTIYVNGKEKTVTVERPGNEDEILKKSSANLIPKNVQNSFNVGYLFLEKIYYDLGLNNICNEINNKYKFNYYFITINIQ